MKLTHIGAMLVAVLACAGAAHAEDPSLSVDEKNDQVGKQAHTFFFRARAIWIVPEDNRSSISVIGGTVNVTSSVAPEVDLSYFFTEHIALEGILAPPTRHGVWAYGTELGNFRVATVDVLAPTFTMQYHFLPERRFSPYIGAGITAALFHAPFPKAPFITDISFKNHIGPAIEVGFDYNIRGRWFANLDVKQLFLNTQAPITAINGAAIFAKTGLDPILFGVGVGYRF